MGEPSVGTAKEAKVAKRLCCVVRPGRAYAHRSPVKRTGGEAVFDDFANPTLLPHPDATGRCLAEAGDFD